eukprot:TRINITY_DN29105_c0_g1_i1.p1 TRINITY_DN29105_c0_g1~~TRINITY_DN29105_c0_g1_i1.p1  ORF type:complete len:498 (+),score=25.50 TRINITY_DN29105_c0_g1_i1:82-1575(+)
MAQPLLRMPADEPTPGSAASSSVRGLSSARGSAASSSARGWTSGGRATTRSSSRRRCCLIRVWRRCMGRPVEDAARGGHELRPASMVNPKSLSSDTDRLLAGVSRLIYRHISETESSCAASSVANTQDRERGRGLRRVQTAPGKCSGSLRQGCRPLTAADFSEDLFTEPVRCLRRLCACHGCHCCCFCTRTPPLVDQIFSLLKNISALSEFKKEIVLLAVIYIERLLARHAALHLSTSNWRPILISCLHLASKTWEDVHAWNTEFVAYLQWALGLRYPVRSLHRLELQVLTGLEFNVEVQAEVWGAYLFALMEADGTGTPPPWPEEASEFPPRSTSCSYLEDMTVSGLALLTEKPRPAVESDCPPSPSSASSSCREVRSRVPDYWASIASCNTTATASSPRMRRALSTACASTQGDVFATFCGQSPEEQDFRPQLPPRLDASHPLLGYFRHAPRAEPPSPYIQGRSKSSPKMQGASLNHRGRPKFQGREQPTPLRNR